MRKLLVASMWCSVCVGVNADTDVFDLSLEELMNVPVSIASRREQAWRDVPAAVSVLTADDIRQSGLTSLAEILRLIPGVSVNRYDANKWGISIRGFNSRFANKLLVLMDGRTLYTPLFSGTYWDVQDYPLEDIERIEVIRGPGGSVWGANAVNGVINIVTKSAEKTRAGVADLIVGNEDSKIVASVRQGFRIGDTFGRAYAHYRDMDNGEIMGAQSGNNNFRQLGSQASDSWDKVQTGARVDNQCSPWCWGASFDAYRGTLGQTRIARPAPNLPLAALDDEITVAGHNLILRANDPSATSPWQTQATFDHTEREDASFDHDLDQWQIDAQQTRFFDSAKQSALTYGVTFRHYNDVAQGKTSFRLMPSHGNENVHSAFAQWETPLWQPDLALTIGSKWEKVEGRDADFLPSLKLKWHFSPQHVLWSSYGIAIRTPSRSERESVVVFGNTVIPAGNPALDNESMRATEVGYRGQLSTTWAIDLSLYQQQYDDLFFQNDNMLSLNLRGAELVLSWQFQSLLTVSAHLTHQYLSFINVNTARNDFRPENTAHIRATWRFLPNWETSLLWYESDPVRITANNTEFGRQDRVDAVLTWRPHNDWRWMLSYLNANRDVHLEEADTVRLSSGVERSLQLRAIVAF